MSRSLVVDFGLKAGEVVVFVGAGGKSTIIDRMAHELVDADEPVVITTTTKMGTDQIPTRATVSRNADEAVAAVAAGPVFLLGTIDAHKVVGVAPEVVDAVAAASVATILVEGDGARRRSFKAPGPAEPVIPASTTLVVNVVGIDAIGEPIRKCHRPERVAALVDKGIDENLTAADVATVLNHPGGGAKAVPPLARRMAVLTKVEPGHAPIVAEIEARLDRSLPLLTIAAGDGLSRI